MFSINELKEIMLLVYPCIRIVFVFLKDLKEMFYLMSQMMPKIEKETGNNIVEFKP